MLQGAVNICQCDLQADFFFAVLEGYREQAAAQKGSSKT